MSRSFTWLVAALAVPLAGCGIDSELTCGFSTCADAGNSDAHPVVVADATVSDGRGGANSDAANHDAGGGGAGQNDAMLLGDTCVSCGLTANCCGPDYNCVNGGTSCCANQGIQCADNNTCCSPLPCTAARVCATTCVMADAGAKCTQQSAQQTDNCCLGFYCDSTLHCAKCLGVDAGCAQGVQCCTGACRNLFCSRID
jgi:hypothetical protein